ncbi:NlpC/P60 family protein [Nonomuraea pusilla]|uniref:C40 family peptidase n=1 Tax=Nonomuraea pusilla TaxID=46177 RepID=UPI0033242F07
MPRRPALLCLALGAGILAPLTALTGTAEAAAAPPRCVRLPAWTQTPGLLALLHLTNPAHLQVLLALPPQPCGTTPHPPIRPRPGKRPQPQTPSPTQAPPEPPTTPGSPATTPGLPTKGEIAATAALAQQGVAFSWGGGSPKGPTYGIGRGRTTVGFDCSGLTLYAWSKAGVTLAHYTGAQFRQGRKVTLNDLRKGDLLFFGGGKGDPTHVALYVGEGTMIHAPRTGDVVRKTAFLRSPHYRATYRGAIRPA